MAKIKKPEVAVVIPTLQYINLSEIYSSPLNPRKEFNEAELAELIESIKTVGVIQPILVRKALIPTEPFPDTVKLSPGYEVVCGERRWRSAIAAGLETIPCSVRELTDAQAMELMVTENLQRKDVSPLEEADAFQFMLDNMKYEVADIAARIAKNESFVIRRLQLLKLIPALKYAFNDGIISIGHIDLLSRIDVVDQEYWINNQMRGWNGPGTIKDLKQHLNNKAENKLVDAKFDITIPFAETIACTECPANSACNNTLFPDKQEEAICHNSTCYSRKSLAQFDLNLLDAVADPYTLLVSTNHSDATPIVIKLQEDGFVVLKEYTDFNIVNIRKPVEPLLSDYPTSDYKSDGERLLAFNAALDEYKSDKYEYDSTMNQISNGEDERKKAFIVSGYKAGNYIVVNLNSSKAMSSSLGKDSDVFVAEQRSALNQKISRGRELDAEKLYDKIKPSLAALPILKEVDTENIMLSTIESTTLIALAYKMIGWNWQSSEEIRIKLKLLKSANGKEILEAITAAPLEVRSFIVRCALFSSFSTDQANSLGGEVIRSLANEWNTGVYNEMVADQEAIKVKREARLNQRIEELDNK